LGEILSSAAVSRAARVQGEKPELPELLNQQTLPVAGEDKGEVKPRIALIARMADETISV